MIFPQTRVRVADNSGARELMCIRVLGSSNKKYGEIGDIIVGAVKNAHPTAPIKKGELVRAVIVRTKNPLHRADGSHIKFDENAVVVIDELGNPRATRIFGPVTRELRLKNFMKIISLAPEVL